MENKADILCHIVDGTPLSLTRVNTATRAEERHLLREHVDDRDASGLTDQECDQ